MTTSATPNTSRSGYTMSRVACARGKNWFSHSAEQRHAQPGDHHDAPGPAVPAGRRRRRRGDELEGAHEREHDGADDVNHERARATRRTAGSAASSPAPPDSWTRRSDAGDHRDGDERDQGGRYRPAPLEPAGVGRTSGHRTAGSTWAAGTTAGDALVSTALVSTAEPSAGRATGRRRGRSARCRSGRPAAGRRRPAAARARR